MPWLRVFSSSTLPARAARSFASSPYRVSTRLRKPDNCSANGFSSISRSPLDCCAAFCVRSSKVLPANSANTPDRRSCALARKSFISLLVRSLWLRLATASACSCRSASNSRRSCASSASALPRRDSACCNNSLREASCTRKSPAASCSARSASFASASSASLRSRPAMRSPRRAVSAAFACRSSRWAWSCEATRSRSSRSACSMRLSGLRSSRASNSPIATSAATSTRSNKVFDSIPPV